MGDLSVETVHGPSGATLVTDAPKDNEGLGRIFSPTDLVGTALGTTIRLPVHRSLDPRIEAPIEFSYE